MNRILVANVNWLGDCVMTLPVFKALKEKFPESFLAVMAVPRVSDLFLHNPYIDEVIVFDEKTVHKSVAAKIRFIQKLRGRGFDRAYLIHRSFTRAVICLAAGIRERVGFKRRKTDWILTEKIAFPAPQRHRADQYFSLFENSGTPVKDRLPCLPLSQKEQEEAKEYLAPFKKQYKNMIAVNPSANWDLKRWPLEYFISVARQLAGRGTAVFVIGTRKEKPFADKIKEAVPGGVIDLCGRTTLRRLAAVLQQMQCLLSADSGPAHLAAAVDLPVVVLFGPTAPEITAPRGNKVTVIQNPVACAIPCYNSRCEDNFCMKGLLPQDVLSNVKRALDGR